MSNRKQSILVGGLISSAGIFLSKVLGLLYVVPFNEILKTQLNLAYYAEAYNIYSYILNIATAGLPFAIATLIARYATRGDFRTCLLVKKISFYTMTCLGFIAMMIIIASSPYIAASICPDEGEIEVMRNVIILLSLAIFIIPILSSLRGFYQGLKEMELYSSSQVLEQLARIIFLLTCGAIAVFVFNIDNTIGVYFGVIAASVSGLLTIFYIRYKGKNRLQKVIRDAARQDLQTKADPRVIFKELIFLAIPFLLISVFGYCDSIINLADLYPGLEAHGMEFLKDYGKDLQSAAVSSSIFYKATKIIAIPMILAPGFSAAIIPYITSAIENKKIKQVRKYIIDCVDTVIYIALPICFSLFIFAQPIIVVLFGGGKTLALDTFVLQWFALEALCATICPIFSSIVMAIGFRRKIILNTFIFALIKLSINRTLIVWLGIPGMVISSFLAYAVFTVLNVYIIQKHYQVNWKFTFRKILIMLLGLGAFFLVALLFDAVGLLDYKENRFLCILSLGVMGISCCGVYFLLTAFAQVPQSIFHFKLHTIIHKITGRFK